MMTTLLLIWGKEHWELETENNISLLALKQQINSITKIDITQQSLFHNDSFLNTDEQLIEILNSPDPILYIHSKPPIRIFLKFGWILKSLNVFSFFPIRYLMYLSLDVIESEFNCSVDETDIHLLLKNTMLMNLDSTVYDCSIQDGDIIEMAISNHDVISKVLSYENTVERKDSYIIDSCSLLSSRLCYTQISNCVELIPISQVIHYFQNDFSDAEINDVLNAIPHSEYISENIFIVLQQLLLHHYHHNQFIPSTVYQLLSTPLKTITCGLNSDAQVEEKWLCNYDQIYSILSLLSQNDLNDPWNLDIHVAEEIITKLGLGQIGIEDICIVLNISEDQEITVAQLVLLIYLIRKTREGISFPEELPRNLVILGNCICI